MITLVVCMALVPISVQAGTASGPTGTSVLTYAYDGFNWTLYPNFPAEHQYQPATVSGTIAIYKVVSGVETHYKTISLGYTSGYTTGGTGAFRSCGLPAGTYKAYLNGYVYQSYSPYYTVNLPVASETFTLSSSSSTPCYNGF